MPEQELLIDSFVGGEVGYAAERIGKTEAATLVNWIPGEDGTLMSYPGNNVGSVEPTWATSGFSGQGAESVYLPVNGAVSYITVFASLKAAGSRGRLWSSLTGLVRPICELDDTASTTNVLRVIQTNNKFYVWTYPSSTLMKCVSKTYYTGHATCATSTSVTSADATWNGGNIVPGDTMYFQQTNSVSSEWLGPYYVQEVTGAGALTLTATGPSVTASHYIITRVHTAGIAAPTADMVAGAETGAGGLSLGTYKYAYTFRNSNSGTESNPEVDANGETLYATSTTTAASKTIPLSSLPTTHADMQVDQICIYRTKAGGSVFYLEQTLTRSGATYVWAGTATSTLSDATIALNRELELNHDVPPLSPRTGMFLGGKLYLGVGNEIYVSRQDAYEEFSTDSFDQMEDVMAFTDLQPGNITCGRGEIMGFLPEGGAYIQTGESQGTFIVLKDNGNFYRIGGSGLRSWTRTEVFHSSCPSYTSHKLVGGKLFWLTTNGPVMLEPGTNNPVLIYEKRWPRTSTSWTTDATSASVACGGNRRDEEYAFWIGGTTVYLYNWRRDFFYRVSTHVAVSGLFGDLAYMGQDGTSTGMFTMTGTNTYVGYGTTGVASTYLSGTILGDERTEDRYKTCRFVSIRAHNPTATQTATVTTKIDGESDTSSSASLALTTVTGTVAGRIHADTYPYTYGRGYQIGVAGTFTNQVVLESIKTKYTVHGKATTG